MITIENVGQLKELGWAKHGWVTQVAWSPDGKTLAVAHGGGVTLYVNSFGGTPAHHLPHPAPVESVAFHPHKPIIATASKDTLIRLWLTADKPIEISAHSDAVNSIAISPSGNLLLSASSDKTIRLWDISNPQTPTEKVVFEGYHTDEVNSIVFATRDYSDENGVFASASRDKTLRIWRLPAEVSAPQVHEDRVRKVTFSGALLASASRDENVRLWHTDTMSDPKINAIIHAHIKGADCVAFNPDNSLLVTGGRDNLIRLWDVQKALQSGKGGMQDALIVLQSHDKPVLTVAFNPTGTMFVSGSGDNTIRLWGL